MLDRELYDCSFYNLPSGSGSIFDFFIGELLFVELYGGIYTLPATPYIGIMALIWEE